MWFFSLQALSTSYGAHMRMVLHKSRNVLTDAMLL